MPEVQAQNGVDPITEEITTDNAEHIFGYPLEQLYKIAMKYYKGRTCSIWLVVVAE